MQFPQIIDLETAIDHIMQACDEVNGKRSPFVFMVGAGISYPSIPLASEITRQCKEAAQEYKRNNEPAGKLPMDEYAHWLQQAYPQPRLRQKYLRDLIEKKPISPANLRLAHLLLENKITNLVVTPNFDDFLSRALTLFGKPHIVCDHPKTVDRIDPERDDLQIIHIHGTYWFYDCCNLHDEIESWARSLPHTTQTMASLLDRILSSHIPLVIGYSGWEDDVFMTALKRRLQSPLPYNLYWFCYRKTEIDALPEELKSNNQVYFVVPPAPQPDPSASVTASYGAEKQKIESTPSKAKLSLEKEPSTLPAKDVLDRLIQAFKLEAPELTKDPLGFFSKHLRHSLIHDGNEDDKSDIYLIGSVIEKIERAKTLEEKAIQDIETKLEKVRDALRRLDYGMIIKLSYEIYQKSLSAKQLRELMDSIWIAASGLSDNSNEELEGYYLVIQIGDDLIGKGIRDSTLLERVAKALVNKGVGLLCMEKKEDSKKTFSSMIEAFGSHRGFNIQLCNVVALAGLGRFNEAGSLLRQLTQKDIPMARDCLPDLKLLSSAPQASDEMRQFLEEAKKTMGEA